MYQIKNILLWGILILLLSTCIEPFSLNLGSDSTQKYVVYGQITDQEGFQTVSVSMSSTVENQKYNPLSGCTINISDNHGNIFTLNEFEKGNYRVWIAAEYLKPGNSYQVKVLTSSGIDIVSDFDQMPECPEIDSVYYIRKDIPTTDPTKPLQGIQFYVDLNRKDTDSHYYRWDIDETWEHHAKFPKTLYWNTRTIVITDPPDFSKYYCWTTKKLGNVFTLSTKNLTQNRYSMYQLHFVDNQTQRLTYCYSLLINQIALSESAYVYWDKLRINTNELGGLYEVQPLRVKGNLKSTTNPELEILGFFNASSVKTKRFFFQNINNIDLYYNKCTSRPIQPRELNREDPKYLVMTGRGIEIMEDACVECDFFGGSIVKPDYWPY
ncbi:MAG: DUF4249 domain-containing protein [Bacteroidales bacterium]|nr:DUF4249 domain-containing protein [Bacteroidales bacterium]